MRPKLSSRDFSATITALKSAPDRARAEMIRDVVDAFRRLHGSVQRFVVMLGEPPSGSAPGALSFNRLLSVLAEQGKLTGFKRLHELKSAIKEARSAERLRDAIFSDAYSDNPAALREVAAQLDRLDATFVGLCVEHVMEEHARSELVSSPADDTLTAIFDGIFRY
jgi:predicted methyltransferase